MKKRLEVLKREARAYFGARIIKVGEQLQVWRVHNGEILVTVLCAGSCDDDTVIGKLESWLHDAVDDSVRKGLEIVALMLRGKRWKLTLRSYTAKLEYKSSDKDVNLAKITGEKYIFPMTPEAVLELIDFATFSADAVIIDCSNYPHLMGWGRS